MTETELRRRLDDIERSADNSLLCVLLLLVVLYGCETRGKIDALIELNKPAGSEVTQEDRNDVDD